MANSLVGVMVTMGLAKWDSLECSSVFLFIPSAAAAARRESIYGTIGKIMTGWPLGGTLLGTSTKVIPVYHPHNTIQQLQLRAHFYAIIVRWG